MLNGHSIGNMLSAMTERIREEGIIGKETDEVIIPVIHEQVTVDKAIVDTAKVIIRKYTTEEEATLNVPLVQEGYRVEHIPVNKIVDTAPPVRQEGDVTIIPVLREVLVVQKKLELVEEVHVIKEKTVVPQIQEITLKKEQVSVERKPFRKE